MELCGVAGGLRTGNEAGGTCYANQLSFIRFLNCKLQGLTGEQNASHCVGTLDSLLRVLCLFLVKMEL
jgi:hypothetical protein